MEVKIIRMIFTGWPGLAGADDRPYVPGGPARTMNYGAGPERRR